MWDEFTYEDLLKLPPSKKPCFLAGTLVETENGLLPIEEIKIGDKVLSYDHRLKKTAIQTVTELFVSSCDKYLEIHTPNDVLKATGGHKFWIPLMNKWVKANELDISMMLMNTKGEQVRIQELKLIDKTAPTYNFEVSELSNYYVGFDKVLSHNKSFKDSIFASTEKVDINFYKILDAGENAIYIGQTRQKVAVRFNQHQIDPKKASWVGDMKGVFELSINSKPGPYSMTPYEAAVTELYEINFHKGTTKSTLPFKNKQKPIGKLKFEHFKKHGNFNPCIFYV